MKNKKALAVLLIFTLILPSVIFAGCETDASKTACEEYNTIGVITGAMSDSAVKEHYPDAELYYMNLCADFPLALRSGKIDAYVADEPVARVLCKNNEDNVIKTILRNDSYGFIFKKGSEKSKKIREQFNEFLADIKADGTLKEIDSVWFGDDESVQTVDYSGLTAKNGVLSLAVASNIGAPFAYLKNEVIVGYEPDIAARFCRKYGYGLEIVDTDFSGLLANVTSGKCMFGASCITITAERKEEMLFSDPDYTGGIALVSKKSAESSSLYKTIDDLKGKRIGVISGSIHDAIATEKIEDCKTVYNTSGTDLALMLDTGKVDAYICDEPYARFLRKQYPKQFILHMIKDESYAFIFKKDDDRSAKICEQLNEYIDTIKKDGTLKKIDSVWFGDDESVQVIDFGGLTAENGVLRFSTASVAGAPFAYIKDGKFAGYDIDMAVHFCRAYGYGIEIVDNAPASVMASIISGKCDFSACCISITEERKEEVLFSDPNYTGGVVVMVNSDNNAKTSDTSFFAKIGDSFYKTFFREARWKLFLSGISVTIIITVISACCGTLLGYAVFILYRKKRKVANKIIDIFSDIIEKTPVVVILMILYYVVFGSVDINGIWVSSIGFTVIFAVSVVGLLKVGVGAVDKGQTEAALALGYTDSKAFSKIVLPQAARLVLPSYKSEIVALIKATAVVGYITVQDLTKISDIVRSRTYEAFFPLIATAVIYFLIAWLLTLAVNRIEIRINPRRRSKEKILKGVDDK